jgi:uncharacterized protein
MKYQFDGYNWLVRLEKGELLVNSLTQLVRHEHITGAWLSGLGGAQWVELHFYDLPAKQYHWKKLDHLLEIDNLQGNVAWEGDEPALHIHGTFSDAEMNAYAGHVKELEVAATCEILLHRWYKEGLTRTFSEEVGLKLLDL